MKKAVTVIFFLGIAFLTGFPTRANRLYPDTRQVNSYKNYFGKKVPNPYSWLEKTDKNEVKEWISKQNTYADSFLNTNRIRDLLFRERERLNRYPKNKILGVNSRSVFFSTYGNLGKTYYIQNKFSAPQVVLSPDEFFAGKHLKVTVNCVGTSSNQDILVYQPSICKLNTQLYRFVSSVKKKKNIKLEDTKYLLFRDTKNSKDLKFRLDADSTMTFVLPDKINLYYVKKEKDQYKLFYHNLEKPSTFDKVIYSFENWKHDRRIYTTRTNGLWFSFEDGNNNKVLKVEKDKVKTWKVFKIDSDHSFAPILMHKQKLIFKTGENLYSINLNSNSSKPRRVSLDLGKKSRLIRADGGSGKIYFHVLVDSSSRLVEYDTDTKKMRNLKLPGGNYGSISNLFVDDKTSSPVIMYQDFFNPPQLFVYSKTRKLFEPFLDTPSIMNPADYTVKQVFVTSKDGTKVPLFIAHSKSVKPDSNTPVYLTGYGGFGRVSQPEYSSCAALWMEMGGLYAIASIRGDGTYGDEWHKQGILERKQNSFDDFTACAKWLIKKGYTSPNRLAIAGSSNGGLLVAACMIQNPDLFGAVCIDSGVLDMLGGRRFQSRFNYGDKSWTGDYGYPDSKEKFNYLMKYSPLQNTKRGVAYPPVIITTNTTDNILSPGHSYKFTAAMQDAQKGSAPIIFCATKRVDHVVNDRVSYSSYGGLQNILFLTKIFGMEKSAERIFNDRDPFVFRDPNLLD